MLIQRHDTQALDASVLLAPLLGLLRSDDERVCPTVPVAERRVSAPPSAELRLAKSYARRLAGRAGMVCVLLGGMTQTSSLVSVYRCSRKRWPMGSLDRSAEGGEFRDRIGRHHVTGYSCANQASFARTVRGVRSKGAGSASSARVRVWSFSDASGRRGPDAARMAAPTAS